MATAGAMRLEEVVSETLERFHALPKHVQARLNAVAHDQYGQDYVALQHNRMNNAVAGEQIVVAKEFATPFCSVKTGDLRVSLETAFRRDFGFANNQQPAGFTDADRKAIESLCAELDFDDLDD